MNTDNHDTSSDKKPASSPMKEDDGRIVENPNQRANENLNNDSLSEKKSSGSAESEVGEEITDGEDG